MGKIIYNHWTILTNLVGIEFSYREHTIGLSGIAQIEYRHDDFDISKTVEFPDDGEQDCLKITFDGKQLTDDCGIETDTFNVIHDFIIEVLEDEINPSKTDVTNVDFQLDDGMWSDMDDLLI